MVTDARSARHAQDKPKPNSHLKRREAGGVTVHGETINVIEWNGLRIEIDSFGLD